jgi:hypothetical protein
MPAKTSCKIMLPNPGSRYISVSPSTVIIERLPKETLYYLNCMDSFLHAKTIYNQSNS